MFSIECAVGRLAEVRLVTPITDEEIAQSDAGMAAAFERVHTPLVIAADYRKADVLSVKQANELSAMFRRHNDRILRSAILASDQSASAVLQLTRLVREAQLPDRRSFKDARAAEEWLAEVLGEEERVRLHRFLFM